MDSDRKLPLGPLGRTGLATSPLGLAGGAVGTRRRPALAPEEVERAFHEHGINLFFAVPRMKGLTEGIRRLVKGGHRDEIIIVSMASLPFGWCVRRAFESHARAFGTETIDVFLLGWVQARWYLTGRTWTAMRRLRDAGRIRALGFSTHKRELATKLAREFEPDVLMIRYNAAHRGAEADVFEPLGERRPGIIAYTATRWGMLLDPLPDAGFPRGMTAPECYRFVLEHPAVDVALCAAMTGAELDENVAGARVGRLSPERREEILRYGDAVHANARGGRRWMFR